MVSPCLESGGAAKDPAIMVSLSYGDGSTVFYREFTVPQGTSIEAAIELSGVLLLYPSLYQNKPWTVGVFNQQVKLDHILVSGDRIEIYRPLRIDPKEARRLRAQPRVNASNAKKLA